MFWCSHFVSLPLHVGDFFFSSRRRHTRLTCDWSSDVCSSDLVREPAAPVQVGAVRPHPAAHRPGVQDRKSTRLNSSHMSISYAVFCLKKKKKKQITFRTKKKKTKKK